MIIFYSTGCPQCKALKMKLDKKNINYIICDDVDKMTKLGIQAAPALDVNGDLMGFSDAIKWVNAQ